MPEIVHILIPELLLAKQTEKKGKEEKLFSEGIGATWLCQICNHLCSSSLVLIEGLWNKTQKQIIISYDPVTLTTGCCVIMMEAPLQRFYHHSLPTAMGTSVKLLHPVHSLMLLVQDFLSSSSLYTLSYWGHWRWCHNMLYAQTRQTFGASQMTEVVLDSLLMKITYINKIKTIGCLRR